MWLVLVSCKGGYKVHSAHPDEQTARQWAKCKEHDGVDAAVAEIDSELVEKMVVEVSK